MRGNCCLCNAQDIMDPMWVSFSWGKELHCRSPTESFSQSVLNLACSVGRGNIPVVFKEYFITGPQDWGSFFKDEHPHPCSAFSSRRLALPLCPQEWQPHCSELHSHRVVPAPASPAMANTLPALPHNLCGWRVCIFSSTVAACRHPNLFTWWAELLPHGLVVLLVFWLQKCVDFE